MLFYFSKSSNNGSQLKDSTTFKFILQPHVNNFIKLCVYIIVKNLILYSNGNFFLMADQKIHFFSYYLIKKCMLWSTIKKKFPMNIDILKIWCIKKISVLCIMQRRLLVKGKVYENGRVAKIWTSLRINPRNFFFA